MVIANHMELYRTRNNTGSLQFDLPLNCQLTSLYGFFQGLIPVYRAFYSPIQAYKTVFLETNGN